MSSTDNFWRGPSLLAFAHDGVFDWVRVGRLDHPDRMVPVLGSLARDRFADDLSAMREALMDVPAWEYLDPFTEPGERRFLEYRPGPGLAVRSASPDRDSRTTGADTALMTRLLGSAPKPGTRRHIYTVDTATGALDIRIHDRIRRPDLSPVTTDGGSFGLSPEQWRDPLPESLPPKVVAFPSWQA